MNALPRFSALVRAFPQKSATSTKELLDAIGGKVRDTFDDSINTCAIRMSWCLNRSGRPIQRLPGLMFVEGRLPPEDPRYTRRRHGELFLVRAKEMKVYLDEAFGPGVEIYDGGVDPSRIKLGGRKSVQGIIVFDWLGRFEDFGASGHVDLFHVIDQGPGTTPQFVPACANTCYWVDTKAPMKAYLWEALP